MPQQNARKSLRNGRAELPELRKTRKVKKKPERLAIRTPRRSRPWIVEFRSVLRAEIANCLTHGIGAGLAIAGLIVLVALSPPGDFWRVFSFSVYGTCMILLYLASMLCHSFPDPKVKRLFRVLDHSAIFLAIAGSYTPFTLVTMRGPWGWTLFGLIWTFAILGIVFKVYFVNKFRLLSVLIYVAMGWLALIAIKPLWESVPQGGLVLVLAGGLAYTVGTYFYANRKMPMSHMVWHMFVLVGSICHYFAVLMYVLPVQA